MQKITLNLIPDGVPPVVYVNQFDTGREFQISFKEGLSPYNFPSGVVFRINGRKADNHVFEYTESDKWDATHSIITKSGSGTSLTVTIATSEQMTAAAGDAEVQLTFKNSSASNDILGTLNFILAVQEKPNANGDPSESDLPDRVESVNGIGPDANGNVSLPPALGAIGAHNIAPVEPTRIMSTARAAGTQVYVTADDQLYNIISPIGAGGTLTPGTNAIASSISSDLANIDPSNFVLLATININTTSGSIQSLASYKYLYLALNVNNNTKTMIIDRASAIGKNILIELVAPRAAGAISKDNFYSDLAVLYSVNIANTGSYTAESAYLNANFVGELKIYGVK